MMPRSATLKTHWRVSGSPYRYQRQKELGWTIMEDSGRGWRRTVPSPQPLEIIGA